jgi:2-polyprenyl-3-methyl-5-hydroxy-6-metoxy-1,4-benzoquinol methylase
MDGLSVEKVKQKIMENIEHRDIPDVNLLPVFQAVTVAPINPPTPVSTRPGVIGKYVAWGLEHKERLKKIPLLGAAAAWFYQGMKKRRGIKALKNFPVLGKLAWWAYMLLKAPWKIIEIFGRVQKLENEKITLTLAINEISNRHKHDLEALLSNLEEAKLQTQQNLFSLEYKIQLLEGDSEHGNNMSDEDYAALEAKFRGSTEQIKERQKFYLPSIRHAMATVQNAPVLDVGCGRGEWLSLLKQAGLPAKGIDINKKFIEIARQAGADALEADAVEYLHSQPESTLGGVTAFHVVEHLPVRVLSMFIKEVYRVLKPSGIVIFETPNPENIIVGACNFHIDPTHRNPLPPVTLKFFLENQGFANIQTIGLCPLNLLPEPKADPGLKPLVDMVNMGQDYGIIGFKP